MEPDRIREARAAAHGIVRRTPVVTSATLSRRSGGNVVLKAENLQRTGSFKLRGAMAKLSSAQKSEAVVAGSAGNHGQAVAYAARVLGKRCEVFMPTDAAVAKVEATASFGARVHLHGVHLDETLLAAQDHCRETGALFVHPFDDEDVIAGQATLGEELIEDINELGLVVVPLGGGGLAAGVAMAVKQRIPTARVIGIQVAGFASFPGSLAQGRPVPVRGTATIADGIAVKKPGGLTLPLIERWLDDVVVVGEEAVAEAMVLLLERAKLVVEGAGAVGVAALLEGLVQVPSSATTAVVLSGGNVDSGLLSTLARRHETNVGRRLVLFTRISDRPGALAELLHSAADAGANLLRASHLREGIALGVRETGVQLVLETRSESHGNDVVVALKSAGYDVSVLNDLL